MRVHPPNARMGTCCSTSKRAEGEGVTSQDNDTIANPIHPTPSAASNEEHEGQKTGEQKMEEVLAQFDRSFDLGLVRHAMDPALRKVFDEDPLMLGLTVKELRRILENISPDHPLCTPAPLVGEMAPTSRAEADALVAKLKAAGGDFPNPFKTPAYRVLTDKDIKWEGTAPHTPIGEVIKKLLNGYDGLEVRWGVGDGRREGWGNCARAHKTLTPRINVLIRLTLAPLPPLLVRAPGP